MQAGATAPGRMRIGLLAAGVVVALFVAIQFVPFGHDHTNPAVRQEPAWPDDQTHILAERSCYACHSNTTQWPWYSQVAPSSWLVQHDVDDGRRQLDFSEWDRPQRGARRLSEEVRSGDMPPSWYTVAHPETRLSEQERAALADGLQRLQVPAGSPSGPPPSRGRSGGG